MLTDLLERLLDIARRSDTPQKVPVGYRSARIIHGGTVTEVRHDPPPRDDGTYTAAGLKSLIDIATKQDETDHPVVYLCAEHKATAILNWKQSSDRITLHLRPSAELEAMAELHAPKRQSELVDILRGVLGNCVDPTFLIQIQDLDWSQNEQQQTTAEAMGKNIAARVSSGATPLAETTTMTIPVYACEDLNSHVPVHLAVASDHSARTLRLLPIGDVDAVLDQARAMIAAELAEKLGPEIAVVRGYPESLTFIPGDPTE